MFDRNVGSYFSTATIIILNSIIYFICQTVASVALAQVINRFPYQIESLIPWRVKFNKTDNMKQSVETATNFSTQLNDAQTSNLLQ